MHAEQAALVALLQRRPEGMRWPEITAEVLEIGSALEVWHRLVPATLIGAPGQPDALESAAQDMDRWAIDLPEGRAQIDSDRHAGVVGAPVDAEEVDAALSRVSPTATA